MKLRPSPFLEGLVAYRTPRAGAPVHLKLDANEGSRPPAGLTELVVQGGPDLMRQYPSAAALEAFIADRLDVDPGRVIVTAGGDDAIERAVRAVVHPGREMVLPVPTFEMFERYATLTGGTTVHVPWLDEEFPVDDVLGAVNERTAMVVLVTPNSPTGRIIGKEQIRRVCREAPGALVLVDLAYVEFADEDITWFVLEHDNALAVRSMSKAWGMAGLRVGWAAGSAEVIAWLRAAGHPYAVSAPSLMLARARLETGEDHVRAFARRVRFEREDFRKVLEPLGGRGESSHANFVLARFEDAGWVRDALAGMGIGVRLFPGKEYLEGRLRITMPGNEREYERLVQAVRTVLAPEALLVTASALRRDGGAVEILTRAANRVRVALLDDGETAGELDVASQTRAVHVVQPGDLPMGGEEAMVSRALDELGAQRAYMACGEAREVHAARRASVLPVGIAGAGDGAAGHGETLVKTGAARWFEGLSRMQERMP